MRRLSDIVLNQKPLMLSRTALVSEACKLMSESNVGSVLIVDEENRLEGIFTGRDTVKRVVAGGRDSAATQLSEVMTPNPVCMPTDNSAIEALRLMWDGGFRHIPVVDKERVVGIVSRGDFKPDEESRLDDERELWEHMR